MGQPFEIFAPGETGTCHRRDVHFCHSARSRAKVSATALTPRSSLYLADAPVHPERRVTQS
jgi:hypothetical protein